MNDALNLELFFTLPENSSVVKQMEILTPLETATYLHGRHDSKTTPVVLLIEAEVSLSQLPSLVTLLSGGALQPKNTYSCIVKVTVKFNALTH